MTLTPEELTERMRQQWEETRRGSDAVAELQRQVQALSQQLAAEVGRSARFFRELQEVQQENQELHETIRIIRRAVMAP